MTLAEARRQFIDGKLPPTHYLYPLEMAEEDWDGVWTPEMHRFAERCVEIIIGNARKSAEEKREPQKAPAPQLELFPSKAKRQKLFRLQPPEVQKAIINSLMFYAMAYCNEGNTRLKLHEALKKHGYRHQNAKEFLCLHGIMTNEEYDRLLHHREIPERWRVNIG